MNAIKGLNTLVFYISLPLLLVSCWNRNDFSSDLVIQADALEEPSQLKTDKAPFKVHRDKMDYSIEPLYKYDITGLVVSYAHHSGDRMLHKIWNDHLNVADICVVWDKNASELDLNAYDFWNGQFTCNIKTNDSVAWQHFNMDQLSNNHLLTEDSYIRDKIKDVRIGDQIRIKGWLSSYSHNKGFSRGTSTTRTDKGNGACETIYVEDFTILQSMKTGWRTILNITIFTLIGSILLWIICVQRGKF